MNKIFNDQIVVQIHLNRSQKFSQATLRIGHHNWPSS